MKKMLSLMIIGFILMSSSGILAKPKELKNEIKSNYKFGVSNNQDIIDIPDILRQVNQSIISNYLEELISFGPRYVGSDNCKKSADYIHNKFKEMNLHVQYKTWNYYPYNCQNIVATLPGNDDNNNGVIILSAHYDTIGNSPGANDDGSGVAAILTIAKIISKYSFNQKIKFVAFSGEEVGLFGSHYDAKCAYEENENIIAVLNLDVIGNNTQEKKILNIFGKDRTRWIGTFSEEIVEKYKDNIDIIVRPLIGHPGSDHQSYHCYGYDGVQFVQSNPDEYHWMHTPSDTIDKIDFDYYVNATKLILATTVELAKKTFDVSVQITHPKENSLHISHNDYTLPKIFSYNRNYRGLTFIAGNVIIKVNIDSREEIDGVLFGIDGFIKYFCRVPPYEWSINNKLLIGRYTLNILVTTSKGNTGYDEMDFIKILI